MKIAILTLPLHTNYGGILQCYALQTVLEGMGHQVTVINRRWARPGMKLLAMRFASLAKCMVRKCLMGRRDIALCNPWAENYSIRKLSDEDLLVKKQINNAASSFSVCDMLFCGCLLTDDPKDAVPSRLFDRINLIKFEGKEYFSITDFDTYLKTIYGDYMQLPPVEDRVSHHLYKAFIVQ